LVDDVPANQLVTATLLRREGHRLDIARSGTEAITMVQQHPYDAVLMDVFMPGMNGLDAARQIRALAGPAGHLPIVAVTANASLEDRAACLEAGMIDMLAKPVRLEQLQEALARHVWTLRGHGSGHVMAGGVMQLAAARLDIGRITELRNSLPAATFPSMVENCLADLQQRLPHLQSALADSAPPAIETVAHAMAGVAATYGLVGVRRILTRIVAAARAGDARAARRAAEAIAPELERSGEAFRAFMLTQAA
jgi:CheY-like chemotaxis protein